METTLNYSTSEINKEWLIKVNGISNNGAKLNTLVGVSGLINLVGEFFANKFLDRAFNSMEDVCVCKLRRGIKVSFYRH